VGAKVGQQSGIPVPPGIILPPLLGPPCGPDLHDRPNSGDRMTLIPTTTRACLFDPGTDRLIPWVS